MTRITIPFSSGSREDVDPKVMPEGALKRVENLRMRRDGRLGPRNGYTALAVSSAISASTIYFTDLVSFNGRLLALASDRATNGLGNTPPPRDVYEYVNQTQFAWRPTDGDGDSRLGLASEVRDVGRIPSQDSDVNAIDVAAGGGLVCCVSSSSASSDGAKVHIFDPDTDSTILLTSIAESVARVVAVGSVFFIIAADSADDSVPLYRYNPATDSDLVALTDAFAAGAGNLTTFDARTNEAGTGFVVALSRDTPTVSIKLFDSTGTVTQTITGPAVTAVRLSVLQQATRVHLLVVESLPAEVDLYTYLISGGALENSTTGLAGGATTLRQPVMCVTSNSTTTLLVMFEDDGDPIVYQVRIVASSHVADFPKQWDNVRLNSKLVTAGSVTELFGGLFADNADVDTNFLGGVRIISPEQKIVCATDKGLAGIALASRLPSIAYDSTADRYYWARIVNDQDGRGNPVVAEIAFAVRERRQCASIDNQLYISGGAPQIYAGRQVVEAGFLNRPVIISATPSNGSGSITPGELYTLAATFEWYDEQGQLHQSEPSDVAEVTMGGSDDTITVIVTSPLSLRCNSTNEEYGSACKVVIWRSLAAPDKQLLRDKAEVVSVTNFGGSVTVSLTQADSTLADEAVIYTQGASGARSGPNPFVSPLPCRYIWSSSDRLVTAGLLQDCEIQESRAAFPGEPITWAQNLGGIASGPEKVLAVARLDERRIAFTANSILEFSGEGLDINGVGDLGFPRRLPSPGGLYGGRLGWRSLVETQVGVYFQLAADSIFLLPRGGGAPVFVGKPVRDTLRDYPVITSAVYLKTDQLVVFTCNNTGGTTGRALIHDQEHDMWFIDSGTELNGVFSAAEFQGRHVILGSTGLGVSIQDESRPEPVFINQLTATVETGTLYPFGQGGQGQLDEIQLFGEWLGNCTLTASLSFDDGVTYTALTAKTLTSPTYTSGQSITLKWGPQRMRGDRIRIKFVSTAADSNPSAYMIFNYATVDFTPSGRSALRDTAQKG
jgi:hypothetical protein